MKKCLGVALVVLTSFYIFGCSKKEVAVEEPQAIMTMEGLSNVAPTTAPAVSQPVPVVSPASTEEKLKPLPPAGPYNPSGLDIQTALKNAGYYAGETDGKIGSMTKKAIMDFQQANNLKADGKVGPKTWAELSKHLNSTDVSTKTKKR